MIRKLRARAGEIPFLAYAFVAVYVIGFTAHPNDRFGYFMGVVVVGLIWLIDAALARDRQAARMAGLPRLRLTGEELDALAPSGLFAVDWDEYDEFVRLDDVYREVPT